MSDRQPSVYEGSDLEALADLPNYQRWIVDSFGGKVRGRVLEVGAGIGSITRLYARETRETVVVEPARNLLPRLREAMRPFSNVVVVSGSLEDAMGGSDADFSPGSFDAAVLVNVLEHVGDDGAMLRTLRGLLRPGGALVLFVPALAWLFGSLDRLVHHERRYSADSLGAIVRASGFVVETLRYLDVLGVLPWFVAGRILRQGSFDARAAKLYDSVAVPVGRAIEGVLSPPLGKNLLCLAQKG